MYRGLRQGTWVTRYSWPNAIPFRVWEPTVPRIKDFYTDCAFYVYRSLAEAKAGERSGGSGFLACIPLTGNPESGFVYAISNSHVIKKAKTPVIRLNRKDGTSEYVSTEASQWTMHEGGDDIAVFLLAMNLGDIKYSAIPIGIFMTPFLLAEEDVGIGDDTFMIGRFVNHEGKQQNTPSVRFGNVAMMPKERIETRHGVAQESFLVEIRSLPGYSGSAVFLYSPCAMNDMSVRRFGVEKGQNIDLLNPRLATPEGQAEMQKAFIVAFHPKGPYLLGIDWSHILRKNPVKEKGTEGPHSDGWYVEENTGMAAVIPAWKIAEVLYSEELRAMRENEEKKMAARDIYVSLDDASNETVPDDVFTKNDFEDALKKVSRRIPPSQSGEGK
jgi:hypothetical protein